jgi:hypothetical protein
MFRWRLVILRTSENQIMPKNKDLNRLIRARAKKSGRGYQAELAVFLAEKESASQRPEANGVPVELETAESVLSRVDASKPLFVDPADVVSRLEKFLEGPDEIISRVEGVLCGSSEAR